ncbi:hypothetical protein PG994_014836 [Apiospora phragmitis]|uniref:Uncharacterized protein n=1 Tax=Apiospora phragmitis TaxID=2905665 RepID=A0ABR1SUS2_9PEZI
MKASYSASILVLLYAVLGLASPTVTVAAPGQAAATSDDGESDANDFLALVKGWQHRRASGYYLLADACGDVITEYHEPRHMKLAGCNVTQCTDELRDDEAETMWRRAPSTWCNGPAIRSADPVTSLMGHLSYHIKLMTTHQEHVGRVGEW